MTATAHERTKSPRNALRENDLVTIKEAQRIAEYLIDEAKADMMNAIAGEMHIHLAVHHKRPWYRRLWPR